jgi:hypothetical protein
MLDSWGEGACRPNISGEKLRTNCQGIYSWDGVKNYTHDIYFKASLYYLNTSILHLKFNTSKTKLVEQFNMNTSTLQVVHFNPSTLDSWGEGEGGRAEQIFLGENREQIFKVHIGGRANVQNSTHPIYFIASLYHLNTCMNASCELQHLKKKFVQQFHMNPSTLQLPPFNVNISTLNTSQLQL